MHSYDAFIYYRQSVEVNARVLVRSPLIRSSLEFMFIVFSSYIKFLYIFLFIWKLDILFDEVKVGVL